MQRDSLEGLAANVRQDVRAHQRTYEGAYTRTAISSLLFAVVIIKLFSPEFLPIGIVYTVYGFVLYAVGLVKARRLDTYAADGAGEGSDLFQTAGDSVLVLAGVSVATYVALLVLVLRLLAD